MLAADAGAQEWVGPVQDALAQVIAQTAAQMSWRPNRSLVVRVFTDIDAAIPVFTRYALATFRNETPDHIAQTTRDGMSWALSNPGDFGSGTILLINLTQPNRQDPSSVRFRLVSTYTFVAVSGVAESGSIAQWLRQGLGSYQQERNTGIASGHLGRALEEQRAGRGIPLGDITRIDDWTSQTETRGASVVQSRCHAAVMYLIERYGFERVVQLVRDNRTSGDLARFETVLSNLTGSDMAGLDAAVGAWLMGAPPTASGASDTGEFHMDIVTTGGSNGEATVTLDRPLACGTDSLPATGARLIFPVALRADGSFSGNGSARNGVLSLDGRLDSGGASGTLQYATSDGCDTGPISFTSTS